MKKNTLRHSLLLLLTAAIWGFAFVAQSVGMDYVQPFTFTAARSLIGGIVLLPFIFIQAQKTGRTSEEKSASWKQALPGGIICGVLLCIASNLQQIGIQYTTVGKSGFITAMYIVLVPVLGILFHKKTGIRVWISVALAVCGPEVPFVCSAEICIHSAVRSYFPCRFLPWITMHRSRIMPYWHASNFSPVASVP